MRRLSIAHCAPLSLVASALGAAASGTLTAPPALADSTQFYYPPASIELRKDIEQIASPGIPGTLAVWGSTAEVVVSAHADGGVEVPLVAIAHFGSGRIAAFPHSSYASADAMQGDTAALMRKLITWCAKDTKPTPEAPVVTNNADLATWLNAQGIAAAFWSPQVFTDNLDRATQAYLQRNPGKTLPIAAIEWPDLDPNPPDGPILAAAVIIYSGTPSLEIAQTLAAASARKGLGLIVAQTGWGWQQLSSGAPMRTNPWNIALADAGIAWTSEYAEDTAPDAFLVRSPAQFTKGMDALHAFTGLGYDDEGERALRRGKPPALEPLQLRQASRSLMDMARFAQDRSTLILLEIEERDVASRIPTESSPIRAHEGLARMALARVVADSIENAASADPNTIHAHPAAKAFPGEVPADAPRIPITTTVDLTTPAWHSTGMYAPPGEVVTLTITPWDDDAAEALDRGRVAVRVGCHTDQLWHKSDWQRVPSISLRLPLHQGVTEFASPFGGLIYIDVDNNTKGTLRVDCEGVVAAPLFIRGKTSSFSWNQAIHSSTAPWAELASDKVILTVPTSAARNVDDPASLMALWDQILDNSADLGALPHQRRRPERYTADVQISAGYMHSGYPIMVPLEAAADMVSIERLREGTWGLFHELGHNHQESEWTFEGTGEVTNNLWSLYLMETISGKAPGEGHEALVDRNKRMSRYILGGAPFDRWKSDPFLALTMYLQIRESFGWESFKQAFAAYQRLPRDQRPKNDDEKRDMWLVQISTATGRNLGPFFQAWGVPTSDAARARVAHLPEWMPPGFPGLPAHPASDTSKNAPD